MTTVEKKMKGLQDVADVLTDIQNNGPQRVEDLDETVGFDMSNGFEYRQSELMKGEGECESACCIGGWVQALNPELREEDLIDAVMAVGDLGRDQAYALCFPPIKFYSTVTPAMGVQAIANCLAGGWPLWKEIVKEGREE
jgi:hypothetical protein